MYISMFRTAIIFMINFTFLFFVFCFSSVNASTFNQCFFVNGASTQNHYIDVGNSMLSSDLHSTEQDFIMNPSPEISPNLFKCDDMNRMRIEYRSVSGLQPGNAFSADSATVSYVFPNANSNNLNQGHLICADYATRMEQGCRFEDKGNNTFSAESFLTSKPSVKIKLARVNGDITSLNFSGFRDIEIVLVDSVSGYTLLTLDRYKFKGTWNITIPACTTPSLTHDLGNHAKNEFNGVNSTTSWEDMSITLTNCTPFYGTKTTVNDPNRQNNIHLVIDNQANFTNGIVQLTKQDSSASGIGIEIGIKQNGVYIPFVKENVISPPVEPTPSVIPSQLSRTGQLTFPLAARLKQISPFVHGGDMSAFISYRIDYN